MSECRYEDRARAILKFTGVTDPEAFSTKDLVVIVGLLQENDRLKAATSTPWIGADPAAPDGDRTVVSATDAGAIIMDYSPPHPLYVAFDDAVKQATKGKGVRHGGDATPFLEQPWHQISKHTGVGGLVFQMVKKAQEACGKGDQEAFERELLGALVYGGAAYLYVKQHGFKK
jgi:hypothetical protein